MTAEILSVTQYTENFIPFELFVLIFIFGMITLILSFTAKKNKIAFSALSMVLSIFMVYSSFFLRWNTTFIPTLYNEVGGNTNILQITNVNEMFLSTPLLWLLIGLFAFSIASLWINVAYYARESAKKALKENKELEDSRAIY